MGRFGTQHPARTREHGFTLIELMMVVAIIGLLASIAGPNYRKFVSKSYRAEAYAALRSISMQQAGYYTEHGVYADSFDEIGFQMAQAIVIDSQTIQGPHYTYTLTALDYNGIPNANYRATAVGDIDPSDVILDILVIENQLTVEDG